MKANRQTTTANYVKKKRAKQRNEKKARKIKRKKCNSHLISADCVDSVLKLFLHALLTATVRAKSSTAKLKFTIFCSLSHLFFHYLRLTSAKNKEKSLENNYTRIKFKCDCGQLVQKQYECSNEKRSEKKKKLWSMKSVKYFLFCFRSLHMQMMCRCRHM